MDWTGCPAVHGIEPRNLVTLGSCPRFLHAGRQHRQPRQRRGSKRGRGLETGRVETRTLHVFLIRRLLRGPTFAAQRVPQSQIFGLPVSPVARNPLSGCQDRCLGASAVGSNFQTADIVHRWWLAPLTLVLRPQCWRLSCPILGCSIRHRADRPSQP
jgi:hypothetical protein